MIHKIIHTEIYNIFSSFCIKYNSIAVALRKTGMAHLKLFLQGRAIAQAVSRWLPTAAARVQVGFVVDKVALEQVFSEYFGFPCPSSFHQLRHHHNHPGQVH
jgi:hypothetical protein